MSIFGSIASAIFGSAAHAEGLPPAPAATSAPADAPVVTAANESKPAASAPAAAAAPAAASPNIVAKTPVDVMAVLDKLDDATDEKLDWSTSIVDLMKLLKLDSSLAARKTLAHELGYTGDTHDSAKMNVWLHKAVMTKLAENGGIVPKELTH
jgi:3-oxoacyl-ACP reductase-like protein